MSFDEQPDGDIHADNPASYSAEGVQCYLFALLDEANRRGGMFPQTGDEQRSDSKAVHRVCEMVDWYARSGEPKPKQIDRLLKLRARNKMTNRETDGDIHGECAAEIRRLELALEGAADIATIAMRKAWQLGQTYWQQADSDSYKQRSKSAETQKQFLKLVEETGAEIAGRGGM